MPWVFIGGWSHRDPPPSRSQDLKLPEGKEVFGKNYIVCTGHLGTESHSYQDTVRTLPKSKSSDASRGPTLQAGLSKDNSLGSIM